MFYLSYNTIVSTPNAISDAIAKIWARMGAILGKHCTITVHTNPIDNAIMNV